MTLQDHLTHLVSLASRAPWMNDHAHKEWKRVAWLRAQELAQEPEYAELPGLLTKAMLTGLPESGRKQTSTGERDE